MLVEGGMREIEGMGEVWQQDWRKKKCEALKTAQASAYRGGSGVKG